MGVGATGSKRAVRWGVAGNIVDGLDRDDSRLYRDGLAIQHRPAP
jgi:regulator of RNase E activity RraA